MAHNVRLLRSRLKPGTLLAVVVKANAYGHGAVDIARAALGAGTDWLAVATVAEGEQLRLAGIQIPILNMGPTPAADAFDAMAADLSLCVYEAQGIEAAAVAARRSGRRARLHLKLDSGMARLGADPEAAFDLARQIAGDPDLELEGLWTHMAEADDPASKRNPEQLALFLTLVQRLSAAGIEANILHCANSAAALLHPECQLGMVRCGLPVYGYSPSPALTSLDLRPVLTWKARVAALHDLRPGDRVGYGGTFRATSAMRTATITVGYADGYPRRLSGRAELLLRGRRVRQVGRVSMDFIAVDVTAIDDVQLGDEAVIIGTQGEETITAEDLARGLETISWEVLTSIGPRVVRVPGSGIRPVPAS